MDLKLFLKENKKEPQTTEYAATKSLTDSKGKPLMWTIKPLTTEQSEDIREACTVEEPIAGKMGQYRTKLLTKKYLAKLVAACVVEPNLYSQELQDSYGAMSPEELIVKMIDNPGEYNDFCLYIQKINGLGTTMAQQVEEAKN